MKTSLCLFLILLCGACNKEEIQKNAVISAMTNGQWKVVKFTRDAAEVTADFAPYRFQFKENGSVDALQNNRVEKTGTWAADANARTITSQFANGATPLSWLNATWKITNNSWSFVEASVTVDNEQRSLRLEK